MITQKQLHQLYVKEQIFQRRIHILLALTFPSKFTECALRTLNVDLIRMIFSMTEPAQSSRLVLTRGKLQTDRWSRSDYTMLHSKAGTDWQTPIFSWVVNFMSKEMMRFWSLRPINQIYDPHALPLRQDLRSYYEICVERYHLLQNAIQLGSSMTAHHVVPKFEYIHWLQCVTACRCFRETVCVSRWFQQGGARSANAQIVLWETRTTKIDTERELIELFGIDNVKNHVLVKDMNDEAGCLIFIHGTRMHRRALEADCLFPAFNSIAALKCRIISLASNNHGFKLEV